MPEVIVVIGAGAIGQAIARRVGAGKHVLLADLRKENAQAGAHARGGQGAGDHAYQVSKRGNSLRVMAEAVRWGPPPLRQAQAPRTAPGNTCARRNQDGPSLLL